MKTVIETVIATLFIVSYIRLHIVVYKLKHKPTVVNIEYGYDEYEGMI